MSHENNLSSAKDEVKAVFKDQFVESSPDQVNWGSNDDPDLVLTRGNIYEVENVEVHSWHTKLYLKGIKGKFNSVSFKRVEPE